MKNIIFSIILILALFVSIIGCDKQDEESTSTPTHSPGSTLILTPTPPAGFKMFSDYGIIFTYPETYSFSKDIDDSYGQINIYGDTDSGQESFNISWWDIDSIEPAYDDPGGLINLEDWINLPSISEIAPLTEAGCYLESGNLTEITHLGHKVLYQTYHTGCANLGNLTEYALTSALECENSNRVFTLHLSISFIDNDNELIYRFMNHLDNLVCHTPGQTPAPKPSPKPIPTITPAPTLSATEWESVTNRVEECKPEGIDITSINQENDGKNTVTVSGVSTDYDTVTMFNVELFKEPSFTKVKTLDWDVNTREFTLSFIPILDDVS